MQKKIKSFFSLNESRSHSKSAHLFFKHFYSGGSSTSKYITAVYLYSITSEHSLEFYVKKKILTDIGS